MVNGIEKQNAGPIPVIQTKPFKVTKGGVVFDLATLFGFMPQQIVLQKVAGGMVVLNAVMTKEELLKERAASLQRATENAPKN